MAHRQGVERVLESPFGGFELLRHPFRKRSTLRAWDAADAYALRHLADHPPVGPVSVINDGFGALTVGLHHLSPAVVTDSSASATAIIENLDRNGLDPVAVATEIAELPDQLGLVVIKVQKSLGLLEDQLHALRPKLTDRTSVLGAGMVRDVHTSTLGLFESILGQTTTSLARQKARLIHCVPNLDLPPPANPWPIIWDHGGIAVHNRGGVFSARSIDIGTRFLLENIPATGHGPGRVIDLGCGNGVVGTVAGRLAEGAEVVFIDSSAVAIASARRTWAANNGDRPAIFHHAHRMTGLVANSSADLVLNNPPFHDERAVGDATAWDMFVDSHRVLRPGGRLVVVANRHLGHHARLNKIFGNVETVAANRKFVVQSARR